MGIDGIAPEVVREGPGKQLVEDAALVNVQVVGNFIVSPRREAARMIISSVEAVPSSQADSIRQDHAGYRIGRLDEVSDILVLRFWIGGKHTAIPTPGTIGSLASSATSPGYNSTKSGCS